MKSSRSTWCEQDGVGYDDLSCEEIREPVEPQRYELFYSTGGHGGPYHTLHEAQEWAIRLLKGNANEQYIIIAVYDKNAPEHRILPLGYREVDQKSKS